MALVSHVRSAVPLPAGAARAAAAEPHTTPPAAATCATQVTQGTPAGPEAQVLPHAVRGWRLLLISPVLVAAGVAAAAATAALVTGGTGALTGAVRTGGVSLGPAGAVLLVVSLLVGLPHGAVDLLRPEVISPTATPRQRRRAGWAYVGTAAAAALAWVLAPLPVLLVLLVLAAVHFGTADDVSARWTGWSRPRLLTWVRVTALGGAAVAVPLGVHGDAVHQVLGALSGGQADLVRAVMRAASGVALVAAAVTVADATAHRRWAAAAEPVALVALFVLVTPLVAFAVYFGLWHSWRQVVRMVAADASREATTVRRAVTALLRTAAPPTAVTVAVLALAVSTTGSALLPIALVAVLCLTVPHGMAVALTDRRLQVRG